MASPVVLVALAVLLLNDHVLKRAWPGAVTGKLSDVAGPVVAAALLGAFARLAVPRRAARAEAAAWWAVAAAFALCKTVPTVNDAVPIAGVRDPWDVLGLAALPFAWRLSRRTLPWRPLARGLAVAVSLLAVTATSTAADVRIVRLDATADGVRAFGEAEGHRDPELYASRDGGRTWTGVPSMPAATPAPLPSGRTRDCAGARCYELAGGAVRESRDGGATWRLSWAPERSDDRSYVLADVVFLPGTETVLVAYDRWVLRREGDGEWQRFAVAAEGGSEGGGLFPSVPLVPLAGLALALVVAMLLVAALLVAASRRGRTEVEDAWSPPAREAPSPPSRRPRHRR